MGTMLNAPKRKVFTISSIRFLSEKLTKSFETPKECLSCSEYDPNVRINCAGTNGSACSCVAFSLVQRNLLWI